MFPPHSIDITPTRITAAYRLTRQESNVLVHKACREWWGIALKTSGKTHYYQENETLLSAKYEYDTIRVVEPYMNWLEKNEERLDAEAHSSYIQANTLTDTWFQGIQNNP